MGEEKREWARVCSRAAGSQRQSVSVIFYTECPSSKPLWQLPFASVVSGTVERKKKKKIVEMHRGYTSSPVL